MNILLHFLPGSVLMSVRELIGIFLIILFFMPVVFQIFAGLKALRERIKMKFWIVSVMSIVSQILMTTSLFLLMVHNSKESGIRDGLGFIFLELMGVLMIVIILLVIVTQLIINYKNKKTTPDPPLQRGGRC